MIDFIVFICFIFFIISIVADLARLNFEALHVRVPITTSIIKLNKYLQLDCHNVIRLMLMLLRT